MYRRPGGAVVMVLNGQLDGSFSVSEGTLTVGGLNVTGDSYINDQYRGPIDVPSDAWVSPNASLILTCGAGGDQMELTPDWIAVDQGYVLTRK